MTKKLILVSVIIIAVGAGAFYGGMKYGVSKKSSIQLGQRIAGQFGENNGTRLNGGRFGIGSTGGFAAGEIIAKDEKSITIKLPDGGSKIVFYSDTTEISKFASGAASDLETGNSVMANGSANQDGSISAQTIQIRPVNPGQNPTP